MLFRYGKFTVENLIHLVLDSPGDLQPTLWYICEFHSWRNSENWPVTRPKSPFFSERDTATTKKDLSLKQEEKQDQQLIQREKTLAYKEKNLEQKEKNLEQKETLLQQKLLQAELREREALEFEQEAKIKLEEVDEKEQELEAEKEKLALKKNKNKNKNKGTTSSIPTHHNAENADDDDENPTTNENYNKDNQWLLRFSNLQQRLEIAYREIENLRRPVFPAATKTTTITANGDNDNNDNNDNENENASSSIITSLQHELKLTKENAQKQKEENILLRKTMKESKNLAFSEQNLSSEQSVSSMRRSKRDVDNNDEASSVGNRWAPLNFRVERMRRGRRKGGEEEEGEEEGIVGMIEMQKEFRFLGRLR